MTRIPEGRKGRSKVPERICQYFGKGASAFDHWLKETVKIRYVIRYMDDVVILHSSKLFLHETVREIKRYLISELKLSLKENWQVFPTAIRGIDFVGYRHFYGYKLLRKSTCKSFKGKMLSLKRLDNLSDYDRLSIFSYLGWLKWCDSWRLREKYRRVVMKDYGRVRGSKEQAKPLIIGKDTVYVHADIVDVEDDQCEYNEVQYDKDEYIGLMSKKAESESADVSEMMLDIDFRISNIELGL